MIEKLKNYYHPVVVPTKEIIDKINEIIDHLPQEKECKCVYESDCHGIEMIKAPSGKEWAIGGTNTQDRMVFCPWCGGKLPKGTYKQPTKEVPDIPSVEEIEKLIIEKDHEWEILQCSDVIGLDGKPLFIARNIHNLITKGL